MDGTNAGPRLRNGEHGYGLVTKSLHWLIVAAIAAQFVIGYTLDADDGGRGRGAVRVRVEDAAARMATTYSATIRCSPPTSCSA